MNEIITGIQDKVWVLLIICTISGYLIGSISFARLINFMVLKTTKISSFAEPLPHTDELFESDLISATLVTKKLGVKIRLHDLYPGYAESGIANTCL